jgi:hypothetical protein
MVEKTHVTIGFVGLGHNTMLTVAEASGYERRDIAALYEVLEHVISDPVRSPS